MAAHPHRSIVPQNEILCHFIQSELQIAEMAALRANGPSSLRTLADDIRYANAVALIDAIHADQEILGVSATTNSDDGSLK